uniref:Odorant receptor n=1 Tax=Lutzomyia longipalpis TaxID=7200 RepID=A0A7G3B6V1_LUTLO
MEESKHKVRMLSRYHSGLKKIVQYYFYIFRLDFLPQFKCKGINLNSLKLFVYPCMMVFSVSCSIWHVLCDLEDFSNIIDLSFSLSFIVGFAGSLGCFHTTTVLNSKIILSTLEYFDNVINAEDGFVTDIRRKHYLKYTKLAFWVGRIFLTIIGVSGFMVISFDIYHSSNHTPMFYNIPGIPVESLFFYPVNFIVQSIIYYSGIEMVLWSDIVIMAMIMYCAAELRSITELISRLDEDQSTSERRKILKTVYEMHRMIAEKASRLTLFFWYIYFEQLFMVMTYLCIILFSMQTISMTLFVLAITVLVILMQIFILCFFGQIIRDSSEAMFDALYMTKWYEMELTDQKNLLIFMIRFFLPIRVQTFGFGVVSIFTFVQVS